MILFDSTPVLSNVGTVAFLASEAGSKGLFVAHVGNPPNPPNTIDHSHRVGDACPSGGTFTDFPISPGIGKPALNDGGAEAFTAHCDGVQGVYRHAGSLEVIADNGGHPPPNPPPGFFLRPFVAMDAAGEVAYTLMAGTSGVAIFRDQTEVVAPGSYSNLSNPFMNAQGAVAFKTGGQLPETISKAAPGSPPQLCVDNVTQIDGFDFQTFGGSTPINDDGLIAFAAGLDDFSGGVFRANAACTSITRIDGSPSSNIGPVAINDSGEVAYWKNGDVLVVRGSGPPRKAVGVGDAISFMNSSVAGVVTVLGLAQGNFLDNSGRIAFRYSLADGSTGIAVAIPACSDGIDNDGDGLTDFGADLGCESETDPDEKGIATPGGWALVCDNGADDDGDGLVDFPDDPGCFSPAGYTESPRCSDGLDNDGDGAIDHPADPECKRPWDTSERDPGAQCGIGFELAFVLPPLMWLYRRRRLD